MEEHLRERNELGVTDWLWSTRGLKGVKKEPQVSLLLAGVDSGTLLRSGIQKEEQEANVCVLNLLNRNGLWNIHVERVSAYPSVCQSPCCFTSCYQAGDIWLPSLPSLNKKDCPN